jgi:hypothetical protein
MKTTMTERAYIDRGDLQALRIATEVLNQICVANSEVINGDDWQKVMVLLDDWTDEYFEKIEIVDTDHDENDKTRRILEDLTDRACKNKAIESGVPRTLSKFIDWLRNLYPELYR